MEACFSDNAVVRFLRRELSDADMAEAHQHLGTCADCRRLVASAADLYFEGAEPPAEEDEARASVLPEVGTIISRYRLLTRGEVGPAAAVYEARDPDREQPVCFTLVRAQAGGDPGRAELSASADHTRAVTRLSHPNVIKVHEIGVHEQQVFVVTDAARGDPFRVWRRAQPRPWRALVEVMRDVARALAAAHAEGLAHGDFRLDDVTVGAEGRAYVSNFGLGRTLGRVDALTDARGDQLAFCLAFYEGLYDACPFGGGVTGSVPESLARAAADGASGRPREPHEGPRWLFHLLARGLALDPERRHASMTALLGALERGVGSGRRRAIAVGLALATAAVVTLWASLGLRGK